MSDVLTSIPANARKIIYLVFSLIGLVLGAFQVWSTTPDHGAPSWLTGALAVYAFLGGALGFTARANVTPPNE